MHGTDNDIQPKADDASQGADASSSQSPEQKADAERDAFDDAVLDRIAGEPDKSERKKPEEKKPDSKPNAKPEEKDKKADDEGFDVNDGPAVYRGMGKRERLIAARRALLRDGTRDENEIDELQAGNEARLLEIGAKALKRQNDVDRQLAGKGKLPQNRTSTDRVPSADVDDESEDLDHENPFDDDSDDEEDDDADTSSGGRSDRDDSPDDKAQTGWKPGVIKFLKNADLQLTNRDRRDILDGLSGHFEKAIKAATKQAETKAEQAAHANKSLTATLAKVTQAFVSTRVHTVLRELVNEWPALKDPATAKQIVAVMAEEDSDSRKAIGSMSDYTAFARRACWAVLGKAASEQERQRLLTENAKAKDGQPDTESEPPKRGKMSDDEWNNSVLDAIEASRHSKAAAAQAAAKLVKK